ncbi:anillin isoform X2 [Planococcus citri]|uniref:anillin isoform X2 n=1 Tax=Planococcus citri TaxID=170843 RepID=UPI0031F85C06
MDDSFAERMRTRALQRLQKNAHILRNIDGDKENVKQKIDAKPVIAERNFADEEKKDDVYIKQCKNRLANLAGKFKQFDEEDSHVPLPSSTVKQLPVKRKSPEKACSGGIASKSGKFESASWRHKENSPGYTKTQTNAFKPRNAVPAKKEKLEERVVVKTLSTPEKKTNTASCITKALEKPEIRQNILSPRKVKIEEVVSASNTPEKKVLDRSVVQTLESQGYTRTESDAHLIFDFKKARSVFNRENENNSNKMGNAPDPCLLSVAERKKLFERRLRGEEIPTTFGYSSPAVKEPENRTPIKIDIPTTPSAVENYDLTSESEASNDSFKSDLSSQPEKIDEPKEDVVLNISEETCSSFPDASNDQEVNLSVYPVLDTVKQVKFVSTPKPGRLYPSISDLDCDADESADEDESPKNYSRKETSFSITDHDNSFGRDVLCATNSIFSSFQNSKKDISMNESYNKATRSAINEVKELISADNDTSLSLSPVARSSFNSIECPNETASFTYMKTYSDTSFGLSPISPTTSKNNTLKSDYGDPVVDDIDDMERNETDVGKKIKSLEEQLIKEKIMLAQEIRALKLCLSSSFVNSPTHLDAEKLVLLSQLKIVTYQNEIDRIKVENSVMPSASSPAKGNITISNIKLPIRMAVVHSDLKDDLCNNLLCVVKCGDIVLASEVVPVVQENIKKDPEYYVEFREPITLANVSSDFRITVEVYNSLVEKKDPVNFKQSSAKKDKKAHNKKTKDTKLFPRLGESKKSSQSSFSMVGYMIFSLNEVTRQQWILNKQDLLHSPLVGMIMMNIKCNLALTSVQKHGFLTMYEVVSGYGAWSRYWFYLSGEKLSFWKYPEEEGVKDPIGTFDLRKCVTKTVETVGIEVTMRPHTLMLQFNPSSYLLDFKGLTEEGLLLSADTLEERTAWRASLNEVLNSVRLWSN